MSQLTGDEILTKIADAYDANALDDEARRFWGKTEKNENSTPSDLIVLYSGRGGKKLLTLADCFAARTRLRAPERTISFAPTREFLADVLNRITALEAKVTELEAKGTCGHEDLVEVSNPEQGELDVEGLDGLPGVASSIVFVFWCRCCGSFATQDYDRKVTWHAPSGPKGRSK